MRPFPFRIHLQAMIFRTALLMTTAECRTYLVRSIGTLLIGLSVAATSASATELSGFASAGPMGVILFQPCAGKSVSPRTLRIEDESPDAALTAGILDVRRIMLDSGRPLYVEFRGDASGLLVKARQFRRASGTIDSCADAGDIPAKATLWAAGDDPSWRLVAGAADARLERAGVAPVRFPATAFASRGTKSPRVIDAWSAQDGGSVHVEISEEMCSDGRSETAYGASVSIRYGSRTYQGCAARF